MLTPETAQTMLGISLYQSCNLPWHLHHNYRLQDSLPENHGVRCHATMTLHQGSVWEPCPWAVHLWGYISRDLTKLSFLEYLGNNCMVKSETLRPPGFIHWFRSCFSVSQVDHRHRPSPHHPPKHAYGNHCQSKNSVHPLEHRPMKTEQFSGSQVLWGGAVSNCFLLHPGNLI